MHFIHLIKKKITLLMVAFFAVTIVMAQTTTTATTASTVTSSNNLLAILLVIMTIVLAFVIWGLGRILVALSTQVLEKSKAAKNSLSTVLVLALLLTSQITSAQSDATTAGPVNVLPNYGGLSSTTFYMFVIVLAMEIIAILFLVFSIRRVYKELLPQKEVSVTKKSAAAEWWTGLDKKIFTKAVPVEKEADIMLDHDYDGIKELDNALPPWWKYGFYITIAIAFVYLLNFHVMGSGKNPTEEYAAEMENARIQKEIFEAGNKDKIDENNVPMADAAGLGRAKEIYATKCLACHGNLGQGGVGPNLADDYWLHKGSLNDIYNTIKVGYPDKGMQSWANDFTPKEMSFLASYIKTLKGTNPPNPKAPQGEIYTETAGTPAVADSAKSVMPDSGTVTKAVVTNKKDSAKAITK